MLTPPQPQTARGQHPGEGVVNKNKKNKGTVAAPPLLPHLDRRRPQFEEKGTHCAGHTAARTADGTKVRKIKRTPRDASITKSTTGMD